MCTSSCCLLKLLLALQSASGTTTVFFEARRAAGAHGNQPAAISLANHMRCFVGMCLQFTPGPGDDDITCQAVKSISWDWTNNIITAEPRVARKMPLPAGLQLPISQTQAGALVQAVDSCSTFQARLD